jgi:hypothetical protein
MAFVPEPVPCWPWLPDLRYGTARSKTYFLFNKVGLAGCDMGACALLPRVIGQGRASELLYTGRGLPGERPSAGVFTTECAHLKLFCQRLKPWPTPWQVGLPLPTA